MPNRAGAIHLFRIAGIDVFLHWSWFIIAIIEIGTLKDRYSSPVWSVLEYLSLFLIVLLHEFGHAFACRQVGGVADRIMLWPLGGVAYVDPPQRPGAMLWSLAAGPLVNVALLPFIGGAYFLAGANGGAHPTADPYIWLHSVLWIDIGLFVFNILPIYPLDGGQILRSLLWFVLGRGRSLLVATVLGFVGAVGFVAIGLWARSIWTIAISAYLVMNCWNGWKTARVLLKVEKLPRRDGFACPSCGVRPPLGPRWRCAQCTNPFDTFASGAVCPHCSARFPNTVCFDCQRSHSIDDWARAGGAATGTLSGAPVVIDHHPAGS
jgi:Zn-dependent protease